MTRAHPSRIPETLEGLDVLVVGLGRSGVSAAHWLVDAGARVVANDRAPVETISAEAAALAGRGVVLRCGEHRADEFERAELIVVSPGVPLDLEPLGTARERGVPLVAEVDLPAATIGPRAVGVTGSNGKSTTTALVAAMLAEAGRGGIACGNFGEPLTSAAREHEPGRWYAIELSSFQLETAHALELAAAVVLNVQPDHLDRHGSFDNYCAAKARIADLRIDDGALVAVVDDPAAERIASSADGVVLEISAEREVARGGWLRDGALFMRLLEREERLVAVDEMKLVGRHNVLNALAAAVACAEAGVDTPAIRRALRRVEALPHRLQRVGEPGGVLLVDDSKATNVASAQRAIEALAEIRSGRVVVLLGGRDKASDFTPLARTLGACRATAITFGEAGPLVARALRDAGRPAGAEVADLRDAIEAARRLAQPGDAVLLSPACASFDAFSGYAERGERFAAWAREIFEEETR